MPWSKGQSGNPGGRPKMDPQVRDAIQKNGELAVERMRELLEDDAAWGQGGWMKPREQILLATAAQERAHGKSEAVRVDHLHGGSVGLRISTPDLSERLRHLTDRLPERVAQRQIVEAKAVKRA